MFGGVGETRRWQSAIAVVAALGVFVALATTSALRPTLAPSAPPEPAAWSAGIADASTHAGLLQGRFSAIGQPTLGTSRSAAPVNKTNTKPLHIGWKTKERPLTWNRLSAQSVLSPVPLSFTPIGFAPDGAQSRAPATVRADRDILTDFCIARR